MHAARIRRKEIGLCINCREPALSHLRCGVCRAKDATARRTRIERQREETRADMRRLRNAC
jgi:hypothetical protein